MRGPIDFSCKHDILIRHKDGTLTPMDVPYYEVSQIAPHAWKIMSSGDYHYLLEGENEGIAIDTGYGAGDLREFLESMIHKPVRRAVNTHYHFDHSANNCYFDTVYMAAEDVERAAIPYPSFAGITFPRDYETAVVEDGSIIPLKGRDLEVFKIGDHTPGGIAVLDRTERLLFVGDEIMPGSKMISGTVEKFVRDMGKLMEHRGEFDLLCGGKDAFGPEELEVFYEAGKRILAGEKSPPGPDDHPRRPRDLGWKEVSPTGQPIYDCQHPHPQDGPGGRPIDKLAGHRPPMGKEHFIWKGRRFMFDPARLHD